MIIVLMIEVTHFCFFRCCSFFFLTNDNFSQHLFLTAFVFCLDFKRFFVYTFRTITLAIYSMLNDFNHAQGMIYFKLKDDNVY